MSDHICNECQHYLQHYALNTHKIFQVYCGHCTFKTPKRKRPDTKACDHFTPGTTQVDSFVTKEYLSKELLHYLLNLELLPEIEDGK